MEAARQAEGRTQGGSGSRESGDIRAPLYHILFPLLDLKALHEAAQIRTRRLAGAGLRNPIGQAGAVFRMRGKYPSPKETSDLLVTLPGYDVAHSAQMLQLRLD